MPCTLPIMTVEGIMRAVRAGRIRCSLPPRLEGKVAHMFRFYFPAKDAMLLVVSRGNPEHVDGVIAGTGVVLWPSLRERALASVYDFEVEALVLATADPEVKPPAGRRDLKLEGAVGEDQECGSRAWGVLEVLSLVCTEEQPSVLVSFACR